MAEFIPVSIITNNLTECPICTEQFEDEVRIPRRMPCCVQSICQPCLETYSKGQKKVPCPMCRCEHLLPGGVTSLAKEPLILRILEQLKIQKGVKIPCTECPDKNNAVARCEDCCISLCEDCLRAHRRVPTLKNHSVKTFEELKDLPIENVKRVHHCIEHHQPLQFYCTTCDKVICVSCTVLEHEKGDNHSVISISKAHKKQSEEMNTFLTKLDEKEGGLTEAIRKLEAERDMFKASSIKAKEKVSSTFDSLIEDLQLRKSTLLSQLEQKIELHLKQVQVATDDAKTILTQVRSSTDYTRSMRRKADQIEDIQLISSSMPTLKAVHGKKTQDHKSIDIEKDVDASKELRDVVNTYLQEHSYVCPALVVPSVEQQRNEIHELLEKPLKEGDSWYLVEAKWSKELQSFLGFNSYYKNLQKETPGPINNKMLLEENGDLKEHLMDDLDYYVYPEEAWNKLVSWYGVVDNQMAVQRKVITQGIYAKQCRIEVYLLSLKLCRSAHDESYIIRQFSHGDTIGHLEKIMREEFGIAQLKNVRLWNRYTSSTSELLNRFQNTLQDSGLSQGQVIVIQEMNEDGSWPLKLNEKIHGAQKQKKRR